MPATLGLALGDDARGAEQDRDVPVVPARVHFARRARSEGVLRLLGERQRVHVGAQHDRLARPRAAQHADDARARDALVHLVTVRA